MKFIYTNGDRPLEGYTIKRGIGQGGFGEVYYAVSDGGKEVALKLVQRNLDVELRGVAQCMNLKHPNLVTLYDLRTSDAGEHWVVMEYVAGKSLAEILEQHPHGMPQDEVNRWLRGICSGVGYLHDKGIVHRDLKPGNVFWEDGVVKVGDYGLSKFITASRRSGQTESVGTVHYMAPEISRGRYDREIDVYATGVIVYEMLTGDVPFDGESVGEILMKHLTAQPDVSKLSAPYDRVVACALAKDPAARYRSMEDLTGSLNGRLTEPAPGSGLKETLAYAPPPPQSAEAQPKAAPGAGAPAAAAAASGDWFVRSRDRITAWYNRPWTARDYFIAVLCLLALVSVAPAVTAGAVALMPGAVIAAGIALIVMKATKKNVANAPAPVQTPGPAGARPVHLSPAVVPTAVVPPAPVAPVTPEPVRVLHPLRPLLRSEPEPKPFRVRLAETTSAMLLTAVLSVIAAVLVAGFTRLEKLEECALLAASSLVGCWAVIIPAKMWEGRKGDPVLRRLVMAALGLSVGLWTSYLAGLLQLAWLNGPDAPALLGSLEWMPKLIADASYFGLVFLIPRWWALADSRRSIRFNPWLVMVPCFWAWMIGAVWGGAEFGTPGFWWGIAVTGIVATLVQFASPWEDAAARRRLC